MSGKEESMAGANRNCAEVQQSINNALGQLQNLERQKARTRNSARLAQIQQQINRLLQEIATFQQEAQDLNCP
jgi:type VI protein secretion system component VasF